MSDRKPCCSDWNHRGFIFLHVTSVEVGSSTALITLLCSPFSSRGSDLMPAGLCARQKEGGRVWSKSCLFLFLINFVVIIVSYLRKSCKNNSEFPYALNWVSGLISWPSNMFHSEGSSPGLHVTPACPVSLPSFHLEHFLGLALTSFKSKAKALLERLSIWGRSLVPVLWWSLQPHGWDTLSDLSCYWWW